MRDEFAVYLSVLFRFLRIGKIAKVQTSLAEHLQYGGDRQLIIAFRGIGKSVINGGYASWCLWNDPSQIVLTRSGVQQKAREFIQFTRQLIELFPPLASLRPNTWDMDGADRFDVGCKAGVSKDPSVSAYSIFSMSTGSHPHKLIDDDVETKENSLTLDGRQRLKTKIEEADLLLLPDPRKQHVVIGTYQCRDSTYASILSKGYSVWCMPCRYPGASETNIRKLLPTEFRNLLTEDPGLAGRPTCPERFPDNTLLEIEANMSPSEFRRQMLLDPSEVDKERCPLRLRDLSVLPVNPMEGPDKVVWCPITHLQIDSVGMGDDRFYRPGSVSESFRPWQASAMYVDPSGRGKDETAWVGGHLLNSLVHVAVSAGDPRGYSEEVLDRIARDAERNGIKLILVEPNYSDGMFTAMLRSHISKLGLHISVEDAVRSTGQKEKRILDILRPAFTSHRIIISPSVAEDRELWLQAVNLSYDRGCLPMDDRIEALSGLVNHFVQSMGLDNAKAAERKLEQDALARQAEYERRFSGHDPRRRVLPDPRMPVVGRRRSERGPSMLWL